MLNVTVRSPQDQGTNKDVKSSRLIKVLIKYTILHDGWKGERVLIKRKEDIYCCGR